MPNRSRANRAAAGPSEFAPGTLGEA
jgi:hypothetical protein